MRLPNAELAVIGQAKICNYLLNSAHRFGASKARFFSDFGFTRDDWEAFAIALKQHGIDNEVGRVKHSEFGQRFEVDGEFVASDGRRPRIRTVWQLDHGQLSPRLITAHPLEIEP